MDIGAPPADDDTAALRTAVDALPDRLRPVIVLHYYEDFAVEDIARILGIPQGTVKSRLSRGRDELRRALL
jgi:RNA polymerase sigma-70 factor (ECF subfamily)